MRECNIPINGSLFCLEEVQLTSLVVLAVPVNQMHGFMGLPVWEVKTLLASACDKMGTPKSPQLSYKAQFFEFTRSGLFRGKPVFTPHQQEVLLTIAPWIVFEKRKTA